jgi:hypothetical protein
VTSKMFFSILQTTQSNATQVVISQVETNISGKFSCEGNVMFTGGSRMFHRVELGELLSIPLTRRF